MKSQHQHKKPKMGATLGGFFLILSLILGVVIGNIFNAIFIGSILGLIIGFTLLSLTWSHYTKRKNK